MKQILSLLFILSLVLTPLYPASAQRSWWMDYDNDSSGSSSSSGDSAPVDPDSDGDGVSDKDEQAASEAAAQQVRDAAAISGVSVSVGTVDSSNNASASGGDSVTVNGITMSTSQALAAVGAIADANTIGGSSFVDTNKTLEKYAGGNVCSGCVVGKLSGIIGLPDVVAKQEINVKTGGDVLGSTLRGLESTAGKTLKMISDTANVVNALGAAISGKPSQSTTGVIEVNTEKISLKDEYTKLGQSLNQAGIKNLSGAPLESNFKYDQSTGKLVGVSNGISYDPALVPAAKNVTKVAAENPGTLVTINTTDGGTVTARNISTGEIKNYNSSSGEQIYNVLSGFGNDYLFSGTQMMPDGTADFFTGFSNKPSGPLSPTQTALLGENPTKENLDSLVAQAARVLAGENTPIAHRIANGTATAEDLKEAYAIIGVAINRAAADGSGTSAMKYLTNPAIYDSLNGNAGIRGTSQDTLNKVAEFYRGAFSGQNVANTFHQVNPNIQTSPTSLINVTPAAFATHFYNPAASTDKSQGVYAVPGSQVVLGQHVFSNQYVADRSRVEYSLATYNSLANVEVLDVVINSLGKVGDTIDYDQLSAGQLSFTDEEMSKILGPAFAYVNYSRPIDEVEIIPQIPATAPESNTSDFIVHVNGSAARDQEIKDHLAEQLSYAAKVTGLKVYVYSGGQVTVAEAKAMGAELKGKYWVLPNGESVRVGTTKNHDHGGAADFYLKDSVTGRTLDFTNPADKQKMLDFITAAVAAGAMGVGFEGDYMGNSSIHIGLGDRSDNGVPVVWGSTNTKQSAVPEVVEAYRKGIALRANFDPSSIPSSPSSVPQTPEEKKLDAYYKYAQTRKEAAEGSLDIAQKEADILKLSCPSCSDIKVTPVRGVQGFYTVEANIPKTTETQYTPEQQTYVNLANQYGLSTKEEVSAIILMAETIADKRPKGYENMSVEDTLRGIFSNIQTQVDPNKKDPTLINRLVGDFINGQNTVTICPLICVGDIGKINVTEAIRKEMVDVSGKPIPAAQVASDIGNKTRELEKQVSAVEQIEFYRLSQTEKLTILGITEQELKDLENAPYLNYQNVPNQTPTVPENNGSSNSSNSLGWVNDAWKGLQGLISGENGIKLDLGLGIFSNGNQTPSKPSSNNSNGGSSSGGSSSGAGNTNNPTQPEQICACPPIGQLTPAFFSNITNVTLLQKLLVCLVKPNSTYTLPQTSSTPDNSQICIKPTSTSTSPQTNNLEGTSQTGSVITSLLSNIKGIFGQSNAKTNDKAAQETARTSITIPVTIKIDIANKTIVMSRDDIINRLEANIGHYETETSELVELIRILEETPLLFDDEGNIINSNGLYSPAVINGEAIDDGIDYSYIYLVQYIGEDGNLVEVDPEEETLPSNEFTRFVGEIFSNKSRFSIDGISSATYRLTDPDKNIPGDEYYEYVIKLTNGGTRKVNTPQYTSVNFMRERFGSIGYDGDVIALMSKATKVESEEDNGLLSQLLNFMKNSVGKFADILTGQKDNSLVNGDLLPQFGDRTPAASDIQSVFIYPSSNVPCPADVAGYDRGFMYMAVLNDPNDINNTYVITDGRCGYGDPNELVNEVANHLKERYLVSDATFASINSKTFFRNEETVFVPDIISTSTTQPTAQNNQPETGTSPNTGSVGTTSQSMPNISNTIKLEVKAVGSDGSLLADWTETEKVTVSAGVSLFFRWDASDYQQCLVFLNDNGAYSLSSSNRAMITGNTEAEGFNVPERTATYRIECGGQRNNEFGVDEREIDVTVE